MIIYRKLDELLKERGISKNKLGKETGISTNIISKISKNEGIKTETINRICEYLEVQPGDIMEWIPDSDYEDKQKAKEEVQAQIAELQQQLKNL